MKRQAIVLAEIADYPNVLLALHKAAKGKRHRQVVQNFLAQCDEKLAILSADILAEKLPYGRFKAFEVHDPKQRLIHAACFEDRVFHHAVMNIAGSWLEKAMIHHSYACRPRKGVHKAVQQVQRNLQRYAYFVKIDIAAYFSQIDHDILLALLKRCFKGKAFIEQLERIIKSCPDTQQKGLPIGSLTSQYFANYYLDGLDRFLATHQYVRANIRYMDDVLWWCDTKQQARMVLAEVVAYLQTDRGLAVKASVQCLSSHTGVTYCGFRVTQGIVRLSRRRKRAINQRRLFWEQQYINGYISATQLQTAYAAVHAISQGTQSLAWRKKQLQQREPIDV